MSTPTFLAPMISPRCHTGSAFSAIANARDRVSSLASACAGQSFWQGRQDCAIPSVCGGYSFRVRKVPWQLGGRGQPISVIPAENPPRPLSLPPIVARHVGSSATVGSSAHPTTLTVASELSRPDLRANRYLEPFVSSPPRRVPPAREFTQICTPDRSADSDTVESSCTAIVTI